MTRRIQLTLKVNAIRPSHPCIMDGSEYWSEIAETRAIQESAIFAGQFADKGDTN